MPDVRRVQRVLVVDDDRDIRESVQELLGAQLEGVDVVAAGNVQEAVKQLRNGVIDLIITDYRMPGESGFDLLAHARRDSPGIPAVVMTAYADLALALEAMNDVRAQRFLPKPFDPEVLVRNVRELLIEKRAGELRDEVVRQALADVSD